MLLSVDKINVLYGHALALSGVSIHVAGGEMVFVVGRNGAGKTTLLKTVAGFLSPSEGTIKFDDSEVSGVGAEDMALKGVRYVFQDKRVFSNLTVKENIQLAGYSSGVKLDEAIDRVVQIYPDITRFLESKAGGLSGGQRQLLLIGRALIGEPRLLLIDEPTEGLAAGITQEVLRVLETTKGKVSMVIVEQNLAVVRQLADRVYAMKEGKIMTELAKREEVRHPSGLEQYL